MGMRLTAILTVVAALVTAPVFGQRSNASVRGIVSARGGSTIAGATAVLTSVDTGLTRTSTSNAAGAYSFGDVPVGRYVLEVTAEGFASFTVEGIQLNVADIREIPIALVEGELSEEVTVTASTLAVETIGGEVASLITGEEIRELPLNGRNFTQLTLLMPGVSAPEGLDTKNKGLLSGVDLSVSGSSVTGNLWTVDGANNNDVGSNRTVLVYPSVDAIEEFKIHRNSYGAEFGGAGGAQINLVTRGGTNDYKGSVFGFARNDSWNETNYFLERAGRDTENLSRQDYGYTFGGPIKRDKLHFFVAQEWNDEDRGVVRSGFVPTEAERRGDFSGPRIPGCSAPIPIDPLTGQPFPGNIIPADRLSAGGLAYLNLYPRPNTTPAAGSCANWVDSVDTPIEWQQRNARLDFTPTNNTRLMVRYTHDDWENGAPNAGEANGLWGDDAFPAVDSAWIQPGDSVVAQLAQTLNENAVNTLQFSYSGNSIDIERGGQDPGLNNRINGLIPPIFPADGKEGDDERSHPVFWGGQGYAALWNIAPWSNEQDLYALKDDYERVFGNHWVKAGVNYSQNSKRENIGGASAFETPQFWGAAGINGWGATSGNVLADFLLDGMTFGFSENSSQPSPELEWQDIEVYVADSWKLRSNLTLDLGLRYSQFRAPEAKDGKLAAFNPALFDPALGNDPCNGLMLTPEQRNACAEAGFRGGQVGPSSALVEQDNDNVAPRLGLAWDVFGNGKTAIRAGFGQFYQRDRVNIQLEFAGNPPFIESVSGIRRLDDANEPCGGCFAVNGGVPRVGINPDYETPYNNQWNLTWEQELWREALLELSYVGSRGVHLARRRDINQVPSGDLDGNGVSDRLDYVRANGNSGRLASLRPYGVFGDTGILFWDNDGKSEYHSLQSQFRVRWGGASQFQVSYTWSKMKSNDPLNDSGAGTFAGQITDLEDPNVDWGRSAVNREHVANMGLIWNLPEPKKPGVMQALFGGWQVGAIANYGSGVPLTVTIGGIPGINGPSGTGFLDNQRPNRVPNQPCRAKGGPAEQWLNPDAFTLTGFQLGSIGDEERGECTGPDFFQVDLALYKNISIGRFETQLRFEVFNVTNRRNFVRVDTVMDPSSVTLDAPLAEATEIVDYEVPATFGQATGVKDPRQFQLGLKFRF